MVELVGVERSVKALNTAFLFLSLAIFSLEFFKESVFINNGDILTISSYKIIGNVPAIDSSAAGKSCMAIRTMSTILSKQIQIFHSLS